MRPLKSQLASLALLLAVAVPTVGLATESRLNFLWLIAEDTSTSAYSCYGQQPAAATPVIDALARSGVRYNRFFTTAPVCSPSRSAFNTGMYATTIGAHNHRTPERPTLPAGVRPLNEWLEDAGYFTANIRQLPADLGFRGQGKTDWNFVPARAPFPNDKWEDLKSHQPFYAQINFQETHREFAGAKVTDPKSVVLPPYYPDHPVIRADYAAYLDAARNLDAKIAKILALLERDGLADNTVVIFMGDNGEAHIRGKQFLYEEGLRVPMIVRWPKSRPAPAHYRPGTVDERLLEAIDVAPTLLSLAGVPLPPKMQGAPFLGSSRRPGQDLRLRRPRPLRRNRHASPHRPRCPLPLHPHL
jgi:N-sulfoglucosamine sulfohydrolase